MNNPDNQFHKWQIREASCPWNSSVSKRSREMRAEPNAGMIERSHDLVRYIADDELLQAWYRSHM